MSTAFCHVRELHEERWLKIQAIDFLGGTVDKNPPANAGNMGSILSGKIPCAVKQLTLCTSACVLQQEKPRQWEAHTLQLGSSCHLLQLEKAHT